MAYKELTFSAAVDNWTLKSKRRLTAAFRTALDKTLEDAQQPMAEGGRMRIDTGFLIGSLDASLEGMPSGPSNIEEASPGDPRSYALVIARTHIGNTFYAGWTAEYAKYREPHDGFLEGATQKWQRFVAEASAEAKAKIP